MNVLRNETLPARRPPRTVRKWATEAGFSLIDQTKVVTAASELARNTLLYGGGGVARLELLEEPPRRTGVRATFLDEGPGMTDVDLAMQDGYSSGNGLGLGLSGARRLVDDFSIESSPGSGTRVRITTWAR